MKNLQEFSPHFHDNDNLFKFNTQEGNNALARLRNLNYEDLVSEAKVASNDLEIAAISKVLAEDYNPDNMAWDNLIAADDAEKSGTSIKSPSAQAKEIVKKLSNKTQSSYENCFHFFLLCPSSIDLAKIIFEETSREQTLQTKLTPNFARKSLATISRTALMTLNPSAILTKESNPIIYNEFLELIKDRLKNDVDNLDLFKNSWEPDYNFSSCIHEILKDKANSSIPSEDLALLYEMSEKLPRTHLEAHGLTLNSARKIQGGDHIKAAIILHPNCPKEFQNPTNKTKDKFLGKIFNTTKE